MLTNTIPLVASDTIYFTHDDVSAFDARFHALGFKAKSLSSEPNPQLRAQSQTHDIRNLIRQVDAVTALSAIAEGHDRVAIVDIAADQSAKLQVTTVHRHLLSDHPELIEAYFDVTGRGEHNLSDERITNLQHIADEGFAIGVLSAPVNVATFIRSTPHGSGFATEAVA
ncbi:hypothetical protein [Asticcacaulis endophyticus]|uniref:Uncharacterized protein n=1 Tax=Asticcacaulis endophyticus TaxID=1395890 RepID=A0A918USV5_9CAUL|nr:hypothetical protein [Asticcacaulis endophyticus]GGZ30947.1 hypothetical protein GCM10011273_16800 [Asticcacaulis endophyticus]